MLRVLFIFACGCLVASAIACWFAPVHAYASTNGSIFIESSTDGGHKKVDAITEPTYVPPVPDAPPGYNQADSKDAQDPSKVAEIVDESEIDYEDLTDAEREEINRTNEVNPILRNAAGVFAFFAVLGAGITLVNYRMELK